MAVLIFCSASVIRQYVVNQHQHINLLDDFIVLDNAGKTQGTQRLYQVLVQQLPELSNRVLVNDEQRVSFVLAQKERPEGDFLQKYLVSVQNELKQREPERIAHALKRAGVAGQ